MAPRRGRLGTFLRQDLLDVLRVLDATSSPRGHERAVALRLRDWCAARWLDVAWTVEDYGADGGSLVASRVTGPLLYSHLDTSLDGSARDAAITGSASPVGALRVTDDEVNGFGLGVARGPAAAALLAFAGAGRGTLLLAGSGTHRRGGAGTGLDAYLAAHPMPPSAIVAKCGPTTVLWEEPGAAYLTVRIAGTSGAALFPDSARPSGGVLGHAGLVLAELHRWRADYLAAHPATGQVGAACGIGAVSAGWPDKPDLLPAALQLGVFLVTVPGTDVPSLAADLTARLRAGFADTPLRECDVQVHVEVVHGAARTDADAPIVRAACAAWKAEFGVAPPPITGWTGSTDGVVLRGRGVDTVRLGPTSAPAEDDRRRDRLSLTELAAFARIYRALLERHSS